MRYAIQRLHLGYIILVLLIRDAKSPNRAFLKYCNLVTLLERARGVEPPSQPWEGRILPVYYARKLQSIQKRKVLLLSHTRTNLVHVSRITQHVIMKFHFL